MVKTSEVAILGIGLMGGSLAGALRNEVKSLSAVDPDPKTRQQAKNSGWVDRISEDPGEILPGADVVILAAPVGAILEIIPQLPRWHQGEPVVIDLGSTKRKICRELGKLPERFAVVGGHPICGKEQGGFAHADPGMYQGATFTFSSCGHVSERARKTAEWLAATIGANSWWLEPEEHDELLSATSHIPYLLATALALNTPADARPLLGPGYRSTTRLSKTPGDMILDVLFSNRDFVLPQLKQIQQLLKDMEDLLKQGDRVGMKNICDRASKINQKGQVLK